MTRNARDQEGRKIAAECVAARLRRANRVITKVYDDALRPHGLRVTQLSLLALGASLKELRPSEICARLQLDDSTLSRNLERMRAKGWLEEAAREDSRSHPHQLTEAGRALLKDAFPAWKQAQHKALRLLGEAGVEALRQFEA